MRLNDRENTVLRGTLQLFKMYGCPTFRINSGGGRTANGRPIIAVLDADGNSFRGFSDAFVVSPFGDPATGYGLGRAIFAECKAIGCKPSADQMAFLESMRRAGAVALWGHDIARFDRAIRYLRDDPAVILNLDGSPAHPIGGST